MGTTFALSLCLTVTHGQHFFFYCGCRLCAFLFLSLGGCQPHAFPLPGSRAPVSPRGELFHVWCLSFYGHRPGNSPLLPGSGGQEVCNPGSCGTGTIGETVLGLPPLAGHHRETETLPRSKKETSFTRSSGLRGRLQVPTQV